MFLKVHFIRCRTDHILLISLFLLPWNSPVNRLNVNANLQTNMHWCDCLLPKVEPLTGFHKIGLDFTSLESLVSLHIQTHGSGSVCMSLKQPVNYRDSNCTWIRNISEFHQLQLTFTSMYERRIKLLHLSSWQWQCFLYQLNFQKSIFNPQWHLALKVYWVLCTLLFLEVFLRAPLVLT